MDELAQCLTPASRHGPARLLILQSTAFCNIDCSYCYLPHRSDRARMSLDTLRAAAEFFVRDGLVDAGTSVVWHAGEPLTVPVSWYRQASAVLAETWPEMEGAMRPKRGPRQLIQTNATLIDDDWCLFFRDHEVDVGISLDGPAAIHDARRLTRSGGGTHSAAMRGVAALRRAGLDCHVICVVGDHSLDAADAIMDFFIGEGFSRLAFSVEEMEGANQRSSLQADNAVARFEAFLDRVLDRAAAAPFAISVREEELIRASLLDPRFGAKRAGMEAHPFDIVTVSVEGRVSTFSPELAGLAGRPGDPAGFFLGDVRRDRLADIMARPGFIALADEIRQGVAACQSACPYFDLCGGGAPSNKLAEHGRFDCTETLSCRLSRQVVADVVLGRIEGRLGTSDETRLPTDRLLPSGVPNVRASAYHNVDMSRILPLDT